jgi:hypothetical protein
MPLDRPGGESPHGRVDRAAVTEVQEAALVLGDPRDAAVPVAGTFGMVVPALVPWRSTAAVTESAVGESSTDARVAQYTRILLMEKE